MFSIRDRTGDTYGFLQVKGFIGRSNSGQALWECLCSCGSKVHIAGNNLSNGHTTSCGCIQRVGKRTHGLSRHPLYVVWSNMMARCYEPSNARYASYGGRGITVCERWHDISLFIHDMHPRPEGTSLERKNNNLSYGRRNCKWGSSFEQANNKRTTVLLSLDGVTKPVTEWAVAMGVQAETLRARVRLGWTDAEVLTTPLYKRRYHGE